MLQLFAEGEAAPPALSEAQTRQAVASGTMKPDKAKEAPAVPQASAEKTVELQPEKPRQELPVQRPELPPLSSFARSTQAAVHSLHARWAAEEAAMRRSQPDFELQNELRSPEMRRLMQLPGMRVRDAYRLAHYDENLRTAAQAVEQGVVERIQQRAARPTENGIRPGGERHQPQRRSRHPCRCGQHDPRPARSTGTPCAPRSTDRIVTILQEKGI